MASSASSIFENEMTSLPSEVILSKVDAEVEALFLLEWRELSVYEKRFAEAIAESDPEKAAEFVVSGLFEEVPFAVDARPSAVERSSIRARRIQPLLMRMRDERYRQNGILPEDWFPASPLDALVVWRFLISSFLSALRTPAGDFRNEELFHRLKFSAVILLFVFFPVFSVGLFSVFLLMGGFALLFERAAMPFSNALKIFLVGVLLTVFSGFLIRVDAHPGILSSVFSLMLFPFLWPSSPSRGWRVAALAALPLPEIDGPRLSFAFPVSAALSFLSVTPWAEKARLLIEAEREAQLLSDKNVLNEGKGSSRRKRI